MNNTTSTIKHLLLHLTPSILLLLGLSIFIQSFFLSRTSYTNTSSCNYESGGNLLKDSLGLEIKYVDYLREIGLLSDAKNVEGISDGCWTSRRVDSMIILVVDALRFDFARDHLPLSIGSRLFPPTNNTTHSSTTKQKRRGTSKLYQFIADPPTVTMQRLKGLTTGGLPTFADITGSFGGANVDEDSWLEQLVTVPWSRRRHSSNRRDQKNKASSAKDEEHDIVKPQLAFVGDDTWVDLFPTQFNDCHPYPSFNTRDLDTVDDGCLEHLPRLLDGLIGLNEQDGEDEMKVQGNSTTDKLELVVAHFLGVDHVGHTYGPNNPHMERKLHQMDVMLSNTLDTIDNAPSQASSSSSQSSSSCIVALVLGDHGMTEDGNHGGGTSEEVNAGLFVHFSPGCNQHGKNENDRIKGEEIGTHSTHVFDSIHQIDLVPTISFLLGLPVPYANIGGLVPDLLPSPPSSTTTSSSSSISNTAHIATALALNAAQVWNYLHTYSQTSRDLPQDRLIELKELLDSATLIYRNAIIQSQKHSKEDGDNTDSDNSNLFDSTAYRQACALYKSFLAESTDLGKQVWTQFNEGGMKFGIGTLLVAWIMTLPLWKRSVRNELAGILPWFGKRHSINGSSIKENLKINEMNTTLQPYRQLELLVAVIFMIFQCGVLTFGNSYIEHEREIVTFFLSILCLLIFRRWCFTTSTSSSSISRSGVVVYLPLIVALCSRINDVLVTGHGLDPSIRLHVAHNPSIFLSSLLVLIILRIQWLEPSVIGSRNWTNISQSAFVDIVAIVCLAASWWEKRSFDHSRNGFLAARVAIVTVLLGLIASLFTLIRQWMSYRGDQRCNTSWVEHIQLALFRVMLFLVVVTGPSSSSTAVLVILQCTALKLMMECSGSSLEVSAPVMAAIWRLLIRHIFFATNHHCSFNRLQFSAAFVATDTFQFYIAGLSLFMNTFGWEILGSCLVLVYSRSSSTKNGPAAGRNVWHWFCYYQWIEIVASCISVSVMKRHLMVWAIFAPRFMFAAVFTVLTLIMFALDVLMCNLL